MEDRSDRGRGEVGEEEREGLEVLGRFYTMGCTRSPFFTCILVQAH